jgi:O-antigen/teichoic acid export membrane protein
MQTIIVANDRYDYVSLLDVVGQISFILLGTLVLLSGHGIIVLVAIGLLAMIPQMILAARFIRQRGYLNRKPKITPSSWPVLLRAGLPFGIITLALVIGQSIDTVMLSWFWPAQEIGWYNAAYRLAVSVIFLFEGINRALVPSLSRAFVTDESYVRGWYVRSVRVIVLVGLPIAVGGMLIADPLIRLLYTDEFAPAIPAFQILIWDVPFILFAFFCGNMTTIVNKERVAARINVINAAANIILNLIFIPRYGIMAAAVVTVVTDMIAAVQFHFALSRDMQLPNLLPMLGRLIVGTSLMGIAVYLAGSLPLVAQIGIGVLMYGLMVWLLNVLDETDWRMLHSVFTRSKGLLFQAVSRK